MENEEKVKKSSNKSMLVLFLAVVLIIAGIALMVTGNNKSLLGDKKESDNDKTEDKADEPDKGLINRELSDEEAQSMISEYKNVYLPEEDWTVGLTVVEGEGKDNSFLVTFQKIDKDGVFVEELETIIHIDPEKGPLVDLPGWKKGEKDLTEYEFKMYENDPTKGQPVEEEPTEEPTENQPVEEQNENNTDTPSEENTTTPSVEDGNAE